MSAIADRLSHHCHQLKFWLPHQLIHGDAHFDNLLWDGTSIGILDFDNMGVGPRVYELAVPLHSIYELELAQEHSSTGVGAALQEALLAGYDIHIHFVGFRTAKSAFISSCSFTGCFGVDC